MNKSKRIARWGLALVVILALALPASGVLAAGNGPMDAATYSVTLENLTHGQPFSPPVFVTHVPGYSLWREGAFASDGIRLIAEMGDNSVAAADAQSSPLTFDVERGSGLTFPGGSITVEVQGYPRMRLSLAAMLGITNDGFTGVSAFVLPESGSVTFDVPAYDAGTEQNNEAKPYLAAFGGLLRAPTHEPIHPHAGILGIGDLDPAMCGWTDPVGRVTITWVK